ncbi:fumarylacetoacetate hydrolase family protein [Arthrobacter sp. KK5.5]|uniref:fumarylacetoacetate hydrolase family protein n=1 Tax=Arthrobacter sp. KK5.5 TaxID=3373084 RepID=UPI003EE61615
MRLAQIGAHGAEEPVVVDGDRLYSLRGLTERIDGDFLAADGLAKARSAFEGGELPEVDAPAGVRFGAPIARPSAVVCVGQNYAAHAAESGAEPPVHPIIFHKHPNTVGGPDDAVPIPPGASKTDWEVELGIVIGRRASYLGPEDDAVAHIAGFVVVDDLSERDFQLAVSGGQWSKGKSSPGFCPTGPLLVTPDEVDFGNLRLRSWVNGEPRQDSSTADMIFDVETIVRDLSQYMALEPGDLICTGTPEGVALSGRFPYLKPGDVVDIEIEGLGRQRHGFTG